MLTNSLLVSTRQNPHERHHMESWLSRSLRLWEPSLDQKDAKSRKVNDAHAQWKWALTDPLQCGGVFLEADQGQYEFEWWQGPPQDHQSKRRVLSRERSLSAPCGRSSQTKSAFAAWRQYEQWVELAKQHDAKTDIVRVDVPGCAQSETSERESRKYS